ncbi:hypothetical protein HCN44_002815 [Aphidius gifuensis]|uniref:C2H2-type domain-containing protein n=1 Tax=Aphidius gifuensis TaxID=684658 RepID=A0A834XRJ0_APHGI|nr:hypothetical protein HCN44_002815 [Aphidius gifuensis]
MRANWEPADQSSAHAAQQQMIYQHGLAILEAARERAFDTGATNNMNISRKLVKNEPVDDNNTGVTPENYKTTSCSPGSRNSSATGTPSPESSFDSCIMTPNLPVYTDRDMLEHQQRRFARMSVHQPMDLGAQNNHENVPTNYGSSAAINRYPYAGAPGGGYFSVPFDSYKYMNGSQMFQQLSLQLSPHSGSQSSRQSCSQLSPESNSQLSPNEQNNSELQADKSDDFDNDNNQDESDKNINNKRKRKTNEKTKSYSCKRCDYVALSKLDFWKHNAIHIRPERRLECPKCPFVTELKHHLRFHMDNHNGAKPFRCEACNYSCVNKSMLKSHEKLHLDILQYRCADCTFAAKYYHSLKKHLKKLHHKAQVILNRDGTPNPLTIIDTYGTRRGPKQKPVQKKSTDDKQNDNQNIEKQIDKSFDNETFNNQLSSSTIASTSTTPVTTLTTPAITTTPITQVSPSIQNNSITTTPQMSPAEYVNQLAMINNAFQMNPLLTLNHYMNNAFQRDNNFITNEEYAEKQIGNLQNNLLCELAKNIKNNIDNNNTKEKIDDDNDHADDVNDDNNNLNKLNEMKISTPLDLSKLESSQINDINEDNILLNENIESSQKQIDEICNKNDDNIQQQNKPSGTRKRKGKAVKLVVKKINEEEFNDNNEMPNKTPKLSNEIISVPDNNKKINITDNNINNESTKKKFTCNYCEISFVKEVMYSLHMGFHGFNDPFHCNSCGKKYEDDVSFFLHICRSEHA